MAGIAVTAAVLFALLVRAAGGALWPAWIPLAWTSAEALLARILSRRVRTARVLKLEFSSLPDGWQTLVVTPVLLSDAARVETACDNLEALGCLDDDANIECLLLGDFADAEAADLPGDSALVEGVRARISAMNDRAGREKYHGLLRPRTLLAADGRYMGRDRKRGALMDLNRLLLGEAGAEEAFLPGRFDGLRGRFRCVVTLDADTRMLPGTVQKLVGAMAHPMNRPGEGRGWAVLQPRMEPLPSACVNTFVERFAGAGGVDCYPVAAANLWMDGTGVGVYAGKGIYEVAAFHAALEGALPEGRILSHDLIEGAMARAAFLGDVALYDGSPATLDGWLKRLHRWTRGDWQLLPLLLRRGPLPNGRRLPAADRFRMVGNLLRSLRAPALWAALTASAWRGSASGIAAALLIYFLEPISHPLRRDFWSRAVAELAALPATALCQLDAALRALWRLAVSGRHLLDWVPSAEAEQSGRRGLPVGVLAAALLLPGLW
ncbi:MAG: hypothetical protein IKD53_05560, partial [Clostridia bacterium]|nr:hypothetical protein [Clostridia bacterium]